METRRVRQSSSTGPCHPWQRQMSPRPPASPPLSSVSLCPHVSCTATPPPCRHSHRRRRRLFCSQPDGNRIFPPQNKPPVCPSVYARTRTHARILFYSREYTRARTRKLRTLCVHVCIYIKLYSICLYFFFFFFCLYVYGDDRLTFCVCSEGNRNPTLTTRGKLDSIKWFHGTHLKHETTYIRV